VESNSNIIRSQVNVPRAIEQIDRELSVLSVFFDIRGKKLLLNDHKMAEGLFADIFEVFFEKEFVVHPNLTNKGYDIFSTDLEYAIQVSTDDTPEKVYDSIINTVNNDDGRDFQKIRYLSLNYNKTNSSEKTYLRRFTDSKTLDIYNNLDLKCTELIWDLEWISKHNIRNANKLETLLSIFETYKPYYTGVSPKPFRIPNQRQQLSVATDRKKLLDELNQTTDSWEDYFKKLQKAFMPLNVLPLNILNNIQRNNKSLFVSRYRGKYYVKDEDFIKEVEQNSFAGNSLNSTLISYGINSIRLSKTSKTLKITSKTKATCPICSLYSFSLPVRFAKDGYSLEDNPIQSAYVNYLLGYAENAIRDLKVKSEDNTLEGYLSLLGLRRMRRVDYKLSEEGGIYELPSPGKLKEVMDHPDLYEEQVTVLKYLKDRDYWDRQYSMIENISKVEDKTRLFTLEQQNQLHETLISTWEDVHKVIRIASHNFLIYDLEYSNVAQLCKTVVGMVLRIADKYDLINIININLDNLRNFIFHIQPRELSTLVNKHNHSTIFKSSDFIESFNNQTKNIEGIIDSLPEKRYQAPIWKYLLNYLSNTLLLSEFCEDSSPVYNDLLRQILDIVSLDKQLRERLEDDIARFIENRSEELDRTQIERAIEVYPKSASIKKIYNRLKDFKDDITKMPLIVFEKRRSQISTDDVTLYLGAVKDNLQKNFSARFFRNAVVTECVQYKDFEVIVFRSLTKNFKKYQKREMFTSDSAKYDIIFLIEAMYVGNHFLSPSQIESLNIEEDYFRWVLNPIEWDYMDFDVYFISRFHSDVIRKRIVNIPEVKRILEDFLRSSNDEHLSRIYFNFCL